MAKHASCDCRSYAEHHARWDNMPYTRPCFGPLATVLVEHRLEAGSGDILVGMSNAPTSPSTPPQSNPPTPIRSTGDPKAYPTPTKGGAK